MRRAWRYRRPEVVSARAALADALARRQRNNIASLTKEQAAGLARVIDAWREHPTSLDELREAIRRFIDQ
jgi:hypothetical protein